ncbi:MAG: N-acetylglucosamine-6-phosphate deacetylase, partial [Chloroflexota bacterium]
MRLRGRHFETGEVVDVTFDGGTISAVDAVGPASDETVQAPDVLGGAGVWLAPALFDSQVNGFGGRDLNAADTTPDEAGAVMRLLWDAGVARFCPTVTTNSFERMVNSLRAIRQACEQDPQVDRAAVTFHIEGPYISPEDGPRGAHPREHTRPPDLDEFRRLQDAAGGRIGYITLAPELPGAPGFVERLAQDGIVVALGHHAGSADDIRAAVDAGARHCTHLGNGAHAQLPRHPNYIWEQLAEDRLYAGIIADGHHLPPPVVKTFVRAKGLERTILVSDAIAAAGLPPGRYEGNKGQAIEILPSGRIQLADTPYLAGSGLRLHEGIGNTVRFAGLSLGDTIGLATRNPARLFGIEDTYGRLEPSHSADVILFRWDEAAAKVDVLATIAAGRLVFQQEFRVPGSG